MLSTGKVCIIQHKRETQECMHRNIRTARDIVVKSETSAARPEKNETFLRHCVGESMWRAREMHGVRNAKDMQEPRRHAASPKETSRARETNGIRAAREARHPNRERPRKTPRQRYEGHGASPRHAGPQTRARRTRSETPATGRIRTVQDPRSSEVPDGHAASQSDTGQAREMRKSDMQGTG
jgi:hypothetical protein